MKCVIEMNERLSNKLKWMSFVATWAVVCIHSRTDRWAPGANDFATSFQSHIADLFHFAVPLFFVISGFFFVESYEKYGWGKLVKRKSFSLYLPMVVWMVLNLVLLLPVRLYTGVDIPGVRELIGIGCLITEWTQSVHFWYVRALLIFFVLSPVVYFIARRWWLALATMALPLLAPPDSFVAGCHIPVIFFFFFAGTLLGGTKDNLLKCNASGWGALISLLTLVSVFVLKRAEIISAYYFVTFIQPLAAIAFIWFLYDCVNECHPISKYPQVLNVMFFVYCIHTVLLSYVGGVLRITFGTGPVSRVCCYFVLFLTFWIGILIANIVKCTFPRTYKLLSGRR